MFLCSGYGSGSVFCTSVFVRICPSVGAWDMGKWDKRIKKNVIFLILSLYLGGGGGGVVCLFFVCVYWEIPWVKE